MRRRWYLGKCCPKTDSVLLPKKFVRTARTLFWVANFWACSPGCYLTFISWTLFGLSNGRFLLNSISVLLSGFGRFLSSCFSVFLLVCILLFLLCFFPKHKKTKNISVVSLHHLFIWFLALSLLYLLSLVCYEKTQKDFALFSCFFCSCFQFENTKNICCSSLVCKVY